MLNSSCASRHAAVLVEGSPDSSPSGLQHWDASRLHCIIQKIPRLSSTHLATTRPEASRSCAPLTPFTSAELGLKKRSLSQPLARGFAQDRSTAGHLDIPRLRSHLKPEDGNPSLRANGLGPAAH
ncbi:hypothetical protein NQZ68_000675 [Dissostichus eleginoides]|nr:hypothetical protein NQZ68_000675 [Dissostichus eleginoides]